MFSNLTDFGYERTGKQAVGFYIAYLIVVILICGIAGGLFGHDFQSGLKVGNIVSVILCLLLSITISIKKQNKSFKSLILILLSGSLAILSGGLGGLISVSYLSTTKNNT